MTAWRLDLGEGYSLPVTVRYSGRRTVALHLRPGPELELRAPRECPAPVLRRFLDARREWVRRHLATLPPPAPVWRYEAGEVHPFLGRGLTLSPIVAPRRRAERRGSSLRVSLPSPGEASHTEAMVRRWYTAQAKRVFRWRVIARWQRLAAWDLPRPALRVRRMRRRWGSCSSTGVVTLNTRLVERALPLIDFVIVHELCHLREFRHSPRFYALMDEAMPEWRGLAAALDRGALTPDT